MAVTVAVTRANKAVSIVDESGAECALKACVTRGNGHEGVDVTAQVLLAIADEVRVLREDRGHIMYELIGQEVEALMKLRKAASNGSYTC
ncbi:MAG: hypothetical protein GY832_21905 [Chloroflexi bacterium]|nr:hypothetical protein [Chloroflexota bacterium]